MFIKGMIERHKEAYALMRDEFVRDINNALKAINERKPADPFYLVGGQTHPTITKEFVAEELVYLLDKYEEKPYRAVYDENGNFAFWYNEENKQEVFDSAGRLTVHRLSERLCKERGHGLP